MRKAMPSLPMYGRASRRGRLLDTMMESLGVDARAAVRKAGGAAFVAARDNCCQCPAADQCQRWIDASPALTVAPVFCPNREFLHEFMTRRA